MKIKIGFSKPVSKLKLFSLAIRALYNTEYSHTYVRWHSKGADADIVYEASGTSVHFTAGHIFDKRAITLHEYEIEITKEQYQKLLNWCMTNAGTDYGIKQAIGIGLMRILSLENNPFSDHKAQVCSEVVGTILRDVADLDIVEDLEKAGPPEIKAFLDSIPQVALKIL